jgi:hypothetical protein
MKAMMTKMKKCAPCPYGLSVFFLVILHFNFFDACSMSWMPV